MKQKKSRRSVVKDTRRLYKDLAWTWPIISPPEDYIEESKKIKDVIFKYSEIPVKTLLNLGCGGGHADWVLKEYFKITGVDISKNMLKLVKKLNPEANYISGDMKRIRLKKKFDAVLIHDSINYMFTENDLRAAFKTGYTHLKPGGVLVTFAEVHGGLEQNKTGFSTHKKGNIEITFIENYYDPDPKDTTFENTIIYLIRRNKKLEIHIDRHLGGIFSLNIWFRILREIGFKVKRLKAKDTVSEQGKSIPTLVCLKR